MEEGSVKDLTLRQVVAGSTGRRPVVPIMTKTQRNYDLLTDEVLFNRYRGGEAEAFDELLRRNKNLLYSLILRYSRSHSIADEIFQEVFLKVFRNKELFREAVSFKAWLVTICKNTCIDYTRRQNRTVRTEPLDDVTSEDNHALSERVASDLPTPEDSLNVQFESEELKTLLDRLPEEQRETFYLKVIMELTFEEIGESMQCSTNTAKSRFRYALETLRGLVRRKRLLRAV